MKHMTKTAQRSANGGSVRCNYCGWTVWGTAEMGYHQMVAHPGKAKNTSFFWIGPYNCYTNKKGKRI